MRFKLGLTGSIGMGKSTTAQMFADAGCAVWDADAAVHRLYGPEGAAVAPIGEIFPQAIENDQVSRDALRRIIADDATALKRIEEIVHPLVQEDREAFIAAHPQAIGVFDIPLLFETGGDAQMDATACVNVSRETQEARVLARGTMSADDLARILARQMPNAEKCARATYVIETDTLEHARAQVQDVLKDIEQRLQHA
ncbi:MULTISPECIES: dephospho-CoA kinase [Mameliella]|uniref:dephospho-CoA kinase n=1 Tax=Mameliella TaxID=1434019 RepID=UPI00084104DF|nr:MULTISPECIES: dephospho-CoA kinase [Mameliella]ODM45908.1 dephospho-CoA kinase [Ruegeria sp. PBVC088]MBY6120589.1 dephospho-CoA kinase [Mameliella alba]MDD9729453.1 dephospho-CoA kinase [Mameliella sp. AT18]OWV42904.1 dephospho-CoA kinase [Mameliella alba]OWV63574.1 dephospho-CoA kinase [Mameliella alba]